MSKSMRRAWSKSTLLIGCLLSLNLYGSSHSGSAITSEEPSFKHPVSQLATVAQIRSPEFMNWCTEIHHRPRLDRKLWEYCYVAQVLKIKGMLQPGKKGIGFAVGTEPLPALFAKYGCEVVASDQDFQSAIRQGWQQTGQFATTKRSLNSLGICDPVLFDKLVSLECIDMNNIPASLNETADFVWSCCSFEHLGSIEKGLEFVKNSIKCLKPGGIAVHTTEYNVLSPIETITSGPTVIFRRCDIEKLVRELTQLGYEVSPLNLCTGTDHLDKYIDLPPYYIYENRTRQHIKLRIGKYTCTSIGIVVKKPTQLVKKVHKKLRK